MARTEEDRRLAGPDEVDQATAALTADQLLELRVKARFYVRGLGRLQRGRGEEDLMQEAILRTLNGDRRWKPSNVDFMQHLRGAMKSIAYAWRTKSERGDAAEVPDSEQSEDSGGMVDQASSETADPEREHIARQQLQLIREKFADDREVSEILAGWQEEMTGPDIRELARLTEKEYRAAVRRIRRKMTSVGREVLP